MSTAVTVSQKMGLAFRAFFSTNFYCSLTEDSTGKGNDATATEELTCKVDDTSKVVKDFKCAFQNLDRDVEALEGIESLVATQERENEMKMEQNECEENDQLNSIESLLEEKKETAEAIHDFTHPCGGPGWHPCASHTL